MTTEYQVFGIKPNKKHWKNIRNTVPTYQQAVEIAEFAQKSNHYKSVIIVEMTDDFPFIKGTAEKLAQIEEQKLQQGGENG